MFSRAVCLNLSLIDYGMLTAGVVRFTIKVSLLNVSGMISWRIMCLSLCMYIHGAS